MDHNILVKICNLFVPSQCDCKIELVVVKIHTFLRRIGVAAGKRGSLENIGPNCNNTREETIDLIKTHTNQKEDR